MKLKRSSWLLELDSPMRLWEILLMHWTTPTVAPDRDTIGTHNIEVVFIPLFLSISESKYGSLFTSVTFRIFWAMKTYPAMPTSHGMENSRASKREPLLLAKKFPL